MVRLAGGDPWKAAVLSANLGGDTDTIGAISASMAGACAGMASLPREKVELLVRVNRIDPTKIVHGLLALRASRTKWCKPRGQDQ